MKQQPISLELKRAPKASKKLELKPVAKKQLLRVFAELEVDVNTMQVELLRKFVTTSVSAQKRPVRKAEFRIREEKEEIL